MNTFLHNEIAGKEEHSLYQSFNNIYAIHKKTTVKKWMFGILLIILIILFLPWTQNIRAKGTVTTLRPEQRPQEVNNIIAGKVLNWYVKEGDYVKAGDTILQLGEVKVDYMDPELLNRTKQQIDAKTASADGYNNKAATAEVQVQALTQGLQLKLNQLDIKLKQQALKVQTDSMDLGAVLNELSVTQRQIDAAKQMLDSGVISLVDFERRKVTYQNTLAKKLGTENKLLQSKQELINLRIEKNSAEQEYTDKISKAEGDRFSSISNAASTAADISKLQNIYANYDIRNKQYYVLAPQSGQIVAAKKAGIGEVLKEGDMIVEIVPDHFEYAVELFISPMDQPLITPGQKVRFVFDGFPAIVFSGWPAASYGSFAGVVVASENNTNKDGKFRVLVKEDPDAKPWPKQLRMGGGANGIALLKDVPIGYELWRNINGFPPDYYKPATDTKTDKAK
ncbi:HlyD family secretion protein [Limnovirga soli]|uniref:HlyD family efflux transporter periplasmic adaptor subunit n=1 Tax=Limnovirga soli TaxID=2656915 RepID=A0A8J8JTJ9_9BACT|nr:HlyD family efflux transporter periplasmic adaptor subunit [Limnovirga soli]NNV55265.1 HlyD family efflux transporter periplasmic adaptor subunit [Limnovirga soli]